MERLCSCYLSICGQTDIVRLRCAKLTLLRINRPRASDADWCSTVEILPVIYRYKTRPQTARRRLLDTYNLTFITLHKKRTILWLLCSVICDWTYGICQSLIQQNFNLPLRVFDGSNCHIISIYSICESAKYTWVNFLVKLQYIPNHITKK